MPGGMHQFVQQRGPVIRLRPELRCRRHHNAIGTRTVKRAVLPAMLAADAGCVEYLLYLLLRCTELRRPFCLHRVGQFTLYGFGEAVALGNVEQLQLLQHGQLLHDRFTVAIQKVIAAVAGLFLKWFVDDGQRAGLILPDITASGFRLPESQPAVGRVPVFFSGHPQ
ncbi:hypothetical protein SDC9_200144 [bioreactor metagenome]|uniref:Uncharacterized protein n=1 Tax=bioreactor metagenome TaxID=1076179 RepID=A0A645INP7_9ZZZZ